MQDAGLRGLAIDGRNTLLIDREETIRRADSADIFVLALDAEEWPSDPS